MKSLILNQRSGFAADRAGAEIGAVSRRSFLVGAGLAASVLLVKPVRALPGLAYNADSWKQSVCALVDQICLESAAERIREAIDEAEVYYVKPTSDFHGSFSSRQRLNLQVSPEATYGERYFEFASLPYYDSRNPCRRAKDLNALEIARILNGDERERYDGVVSPCSERRQLAACGCERNVYQKTLDFYEEESAAWEPLYVRNFTDGRRSYLGFAVTSLTNEEEQFRELFLSPDSV